MVLNERRVTQHRKKSGPALRVACQMPPCSVVGLTKEMAIGFGPRLAWRDLTQQRDLRMKRMQTLGRRVFHFGEGRTALGFGQQKINLHQSGREFEPKAAHVMPGSADLCFILATPLTEIIRQLEICNVPIEIGPVERTGATGRIMSVYIRDPDGNLLELSNLLES